MYRGIPVWLRDVQALHNAPRADDTLWDRPASLPPSKRRLSPSPTKIINSKERVFCQCGSRALQQEARPESASVGTFSRFHSNEKPGCGVARKPGFPFSGSVIAERWLLEMARHPRCVRGGTNQPTFELNSLKMAVRRQKLRIPNQEARPARYRPGFDRPLDNDAVDLAALRHP